MVRRGAVGGLLAVLLAAGLAGCDSAGTSAERAKQGDTVPARGAATALDSLQPFSGERPIRVVCTTGMVAELVRHVGGSLVDVTQLMGEGVDPHQYQAPTSDIGRLREADIIFYNGLHLEGRLADVLERMARRQPTFPVTEAIAAARLIEAENGYYDPHVWFDVALWSEAAQHVADVLSKFDPPHAADYAANAQVYRAELAALDAWVREQIATLPEPQRVLVTAHDAFHYFGRAYGVQVKAIQGVSTDSEAGLKTINELVAFLVENRIKAVFVETSVPERAVQSLADGAAARGHTVTIGGSLYSDAMGPPGTPEGTYTGMVRHNVETIVEALR